jgi:starvation-inducible DNA-binding protein
VAAREKSFAPAPELATPTDLRPEETQAIAEAVNPLIADALALYVKTKNFHWHVAGPHFRDYHLMMDDQADSLLDSVDIMAERVRRIGGTTLSSIGQISRLQTIADDNDEFVPAEPSRYATRTATPPPATACRRYWMERKSASGSCTR